jgi:hypothetical protein
MIIFILPLMLWKDEEIHVAAQVFNSYTLHLDSQFSCLKLCMFFLQRHFHFHKKNVQNSMHNFFKNEWNHMSGCAFSSFKRRCERATTIEKVQNPMRSFRFKWLIPKGRNPFLGPFLEFGQAIVDAIFVQKSQIFGEHVV